MKKEFNFDLHSVPPTTPITDVVLLYADDILIHKMKLKLSILKIQGLILQLDQKSPKFIEDILYKDKLIFYKNRLEQMYEQLGKQRKEMRKSIPFLYKFIFSIKNLFKKKS